MTHETDIEMSTKALAQAIQKALLERGEMIATAESLTGGLVASHIVDIPGSSAILAGGIVAYQNEVKERMLGVPREMIECYGVVSREVAEQMVKGACRLFHTDYALASTGYAEPWEGHEVEIWVAWGTEKEVHSTCLREDFGRVKNVEIATRCVMDEFEKYRDAIDD